MGPGRLLGLDGREWGSDRQSEHRTQAPEPILSNRSSTVSFTHLAPHHIREGETHLYSVLSGMRSWNVLRQCWGLKSPVGRGSGNETGRKGDRLGCEHPRSSVLMLVLGAPPSPALATSPHPTRSPLLRVRGQDTFLERGLRGGAVRSSLAVRSAGTGIISGERV